MKYTPSPRYAEYVKAILSCGHWEATGRLISKHVAEIKHVRTGKTQGYQTHDGGNDVNSARNFATACGKICGCSFVEARGRKRSRKSIKTSGFGTTPTRVNERAREVVENAYARHSELLAEIRDCNPVVDRDRVLALAAELSQVRSVLEENYQPLPSIEEAHAAAASET